MKPRFLLAGALLALICAGPSSAQDLALKAGWVVVDAESDPIPGGIVLIRAGKVVAVGAQVEVPAGVTLLERPDAWVIPGLVDARAHLGLLRDLDESAEAFAADVDLAARLVPSHRDFDAHRAAGVTTVLVSPGDRALLAGAAVPAKTTGAPLGEARVAKLSLTPAAAAAGPPTSLGGRLALLSSSLRQGHLATQGGLFEAFARGDLPGLVTVNELSAIRVLRAQAARYGLRLVFDLQAAPTAQALADLDLSETFVAVAPSTVEALEGRRRLALNLTQAGATVIFVSYAPYSPASALRLSAIQAAQAGLPAKAALAGLTSAPARALGLEGKVGALKPGCDGDLVVLSGPPLDLKAQVLEVFVEGQRVHQLSQRRVGGGE